MNLLSRYGNSCWLRCKAINQTKKNGTLTGNKCKFHWNLMEIPHVSTALSKPGSIFQILTCLISALWVHVAYLFTEYVTKIICHDLHDWSIQTCYQSASSHVTETTFLTQKCFSVENLIIVSLNIVIPIIVTV